MLACLVAGTTLGYTAQQGQQVKEVTEGSQQQAAFDPESCVAVSGKDHDTEWCVANCGKDTNPICPESFCTCEGDIPKDLGPKLTPEQQAAKKVVDDQNAARDAGIAEATAARDAEVAKRDQEIADRSGSFADDRDAEIAKRDADINARNPAAAETVPAGMDAPPVAVQSPAPVASPAAGPTIDWATGNELPQAATAVPYQAAPVPATQQAAPEPVVVGEGAADPAASPDPWAEAAAAAAAATAAAAASAAAPQAPEMPQAPTPMPFPEYDAPQEPGAPEPPEPPPETIGGITVPGKRDHRSR